MTSSLRYAAVALCVALAFTACTKSTDSTSTSTDATQTTAPDTGTGASAAPDAGASTAPGASATAAGEATTSTSAPAASATTGAMTATTAPPTGTSTTTTGGSANGAPGTYIDLPVYPGATERTDQDISMSANGGSLVLKVYATKDDSKTVADWYKAHLPSTWKGGVITAGSKTVGTFSNEETGGDQSVIVASQDDVTTRIQLATKHGK